MVKISLKSEKRTLVGRKVKRLRKEGKIPANMYGSDIKSQTISVDKKEFSQVFTKSGETAVVDLLIDNKSYPVLVHNVQHDPVDSSVIHVDFLKIDLKKKVTTKIPVELTDVSPAEKQGLGTIVQYIDELEVEALPGDLVDKFILDISVLAEVDQSLSIKDLKYDKEKLEIKNDPETIIVKVEVQKEEPVEVAPAAPPEGEAAPAESEAPPAEGEEKPTEETVKEESK